MSMKLGAVAPGVLGLLVIGPVVIGLVIGGWLGIAFAAFGIGAFAALTGLSWSRLTPTTRMMRVAVLVFMVGVALVRFIPS